MVRFARHRQAALSLAFNTGNDDEKITSSPAARIKRKALNGDNFRF